jgi:pteridine reductase
LSAVELAGRTALVTGAGRRVGRAVATALARRGVHVALHYHASAAGARAAAAEVERCGVRAALLRADLASAAEAEALAGRAHEALGALDVVVSGAAVMERRRLEDVTPADWDRTMDLNLRGTFFVAKGAAAALGGTGGVIVNLADVAGFERWRDYPVHCLSKAGVVAMTELLAKLLAPRIRVNAVAPGAVLPPDGWPEDAVRRLADTTPLRRLGTPDDVCHAVVFLLENDFVTGETLVVDGGRRVR